MHVLSSIYFRKIYVPISMFRFLSVLERVWQLSFISSKFLTLCLYHRTLLFGHPETNLQHKYHLHVLANLYRVSFFERTTILMLNQRNRKPKVDYLLTKLIGIPLGHDLKKIEKKFVKLPVIKIIFVWIFSGKMYT